MTRTQLMTLPNRPSWRWYATAVVLGLTVLAAFIAPTWRGETIAHDGKVSLGAPQKVVFIGMSGVRWEDVSTADTPTLARLASEGSVANLVVKTLGVTTCPNAGWLTISYGVRTPDFAGDNCSDFISARDDGDLPADVEKARVTAVTDSPYQQGEQSFGQYLAGQSFAGRRMSVASIGSGAALAVQVPESGASVSASSVRQHRDLTYKDQLAVNAVSQYRAVANADLVLVDLGRIWDVPAGSGSVATIGQKASFRAAFAPPAPRSATAKAEIAQLDARLGELLAAIDDGTTVVVASVADSDQRTAHLQYFAAIGPGISDGALAYTNSTRHHGLVQLTDIPQTLLTLSGQRPVPDFIGSAIAMHGTPAESAEELIATLQGDDARAVAVRPAVGPFYITIMLAAIIYLGWYVFLHRSGAIIRKPARQRQCLIIGLIIASLPVTSFLINVVPWWNTPWPTLSFLAGCLLIAIVFSLGSQRITTRPATVIALLTAGTLGLDVLAGSVLHLASVMGDQPQQGGRFYGLSNAPFTIFAVSMIYLTWRATENMRSYHSRISVPAAVLAGLAISVIIDGAGSLGADFGGVPALIAAFLVFLMLSSGRSLRIRSMTTVVVLSALAAFAGAIIDWLRPTESWTHLGRFFQSVLDGRAPGVIYRKAGEMFSSAPWFVWVIVVVLLLIAWYGPLRKRYLDNRATVDAELGRMWQWVVPVLLTLVVVGVAVNDSGLVILAVGIAFGAPLLIASESAILANCETHKR